MWNRNNYSRTNAVYMNYVPFYVQSSVSKSGFKYTPHPPFTAEEIATNRMVPSYGTHIPFPRISGFNFKYIPYLILRHPTDITTLPFHSLFYNDVR